MPAGWDQYNNYYTRELQRHRQWGPLLSLGLIVGIIWGGRWGLGIAIASFASELLYFWRGEKVRRRLLRELTHLGDAKCMGCRYDRTALPQDRPCPECGAPFDPKAVEQLRQLWNAEAIGPRISAGMYAIRKQAKPLLIVLLATAVVCIPGFVFLHRGNTAAGIGWLVAGGIVSSMSLLRIAMQFQRLALEAWRNRTVVCSLCGYDMTGLPEDRRCPECGGPSEPSKPL